MSAAIQIEPARLPGEAFQDYKTRQRLVHRAIKWTLRYGQPATHARMPRVRQWTLSPSPMKYAPGPHKSHKPHEVTAEGFILSPLGVPTPYAFRVLHPGTLVKVPT